MISRIWSSISVQKSRLVIVALVVFVIFFCIRYWPVKQKEGFHGYVASNEITGTYTTQLYHSEDQRFLDQMCTGHWAPRNYTEQEMEEVQGFVNRVWAYYKIPLTLQREDKRCGNVSFMGLAWFRSLCNPQGSTPCCMNGVCVNNSIQECQCPECYDVRQSIHAELATWEPNDPNVKLTKFTSESDVCRVLQNKTVYFIGDSFMRQLYTSVLAMLRQSKPRHVIRDNAPLAILKKCDNYYRYIADCRTYVIFDTVECNGTATLSMKSVGFVYEIRGLLKTLEALKGKVNSWLVVGLGGHDFYNMPIVQQGLINPLLTTLQNSTWPKLIWMAAQAPGLLKTPSEKRQQTQALLDYNEKLKSILGPGGIPIMNFFQLTTGVFSFDGSHYGKGVNDVKANILLNFLQ